MENYEPIHGLAEDLWCIDGEWKGSAFRRRMTILRLTGNRLVVHNPFELKDEDLAKINALGTVKAIIAPNTFHTSDAVWFASHYPKAELFVPEKVQRKFQRRARAEGFNVAGLEGAWPEPLSRELLCISVEGTRIHETVLVHSKTRTLIVADLVFNMPENVFQGFERKLMNWNKVVGRFGPSKLFWKLFTSDKKAVARSVGKILEQDFDRVIMNHGNILETGGKKKFREAFSEIL